MGNGSRYASCFVILVVEYVVQSNFIVVEIEASSGNITSFSPSMVIFSPPKAPSPLNLLNLLPDFLLYFGSLDTDLQPAGFHFLLQSFHFALHDLLLSKGFLQHPHSLKMRFKRRLCVSHLDLKILDRSYGDARCWWLIGRCGVGSARHANYLRWHQRRSVGRSLLRPNRW